MTMRCQFPDHISCPDTPEHREIIQLRKWLDDELKRNARLTNEMAGLRAQVTGLQKKCAEWNAVAEPLRYLNFLPEDYTAFRQGFRECEGEVLVALFRAMAALNALDATTGEE